jgi:hypothetical protein
MQLILVASPPALWYNANGAVKTVGQKEKLLERLKSKPKDFTFDEAETLLRCLDYRISNKGRTSGSRVMFVSVSRPPILLHKPHPQKELPAYQVKQLIDSLEQEGLI